MAYPARKRRYLPYPDEDITRFINPWNPEAEPPIGIAPRLTVVPRTVEPEVIGVGPAPPLALGRNRPQRVPTMPGEELEAERQYQQAVEGFQPRERGWKSRLGFAALTALQGLSGGIPGAVGAGLTGLGIAAFDPKIADRMWKQREAANSQERLTGLMAQRRGALQDELLRAQVEDERASAQQRLTPKAVVPEEYTLGPDQIRYRGGEVVARGPEREVPVKPRIKVDVPGYGEIEVGPESALNYFGQVAGRDERGEVTAATNAAKREAAINLSSSLYKKADSNDAEAARIESQVLPTLPDTDAGLIQRELLLKQAQSLRDNARQLRVDGDKARAEGEAVPVRATRSGGKKWSASRWAAANPNGDVNAAIATARRQGLEVVE